MSYQVLARKWRPRLFSELVGQEHVVRALSNALTQQRLHHAYLFTGTRGVGKTTLARILAKSLNCEVGVVPEPCGVCVACQQIDEGRFIDLLEIDAASNTGIDNIREVLENAQYAPTAGRYKVYIIDEVHMLSKSAFNAMLKTLEEPPAHVKFILATTDPQKVPVTVLSRCLQFYLRNMMPHQVAEHLALVLGAESIPFEKTALDLLGRAAAGSMRDALSLLDQAIAYGVGQVQEEDVRRMLGIADRHYLYTLLNALACADGPRLMAEVKALNEYSINYEGALAELALMLHQLALVQTVPEAVVCDETERELLLALAKRMLPEDVQLYYQIALQGRKDLALAPDDYAGFSMTLLRMLAFHPINDNQLDQASFGKLPSGHSPSSVGVSTKLDTSSAPLSKRVLDQALANEQPTKASQQIKPVELEIHPPTRDQSSREELPSPSDTVQFDGNWSQLVKRLAPKMGAARMLAHNAVLKTWSMSRFDLAVPSNFRHMAARDYREKLSHVLTEHFGQKIEVVVNTEELTLETPAMTETRHQQEQGAKALSSLQSDVIINQFIEEFDAVLLTESIQPL